MQPETIPAEAPADDQAEAAEASEGRGDSPKPTATKTRKKRVPVGGETRGRKLHLPDDIHDRLWLLARQRRVSVSAVAADILDKNLPRYRVERET
ncbi:MAG: hypothetical protein JWQ07_5774 [Ramlibacter sp.]|nr:hypothetical protein [Ramlibacter sp.]